MKTIRPKKNTTINSATPHSVFNPTTMKQYFTKLNKKTEKTIIQKWHETLENTPYRSHKNGQNYIFFSSLVKNPHTPPEVLEDLAYLMSRKTSPHVDDATNQRKLEDIILYPRTKYIIHKTSLSKKKYQKNLDTCLYWRENDGYFFVGDIAEHPHTSSNTLHFLTLEAIESLTTNYTKNRMKNRLWYPALINIASHPHLLPQTAAILADHWSIPLEAKTALAHNSCCPPLLAVHVALSI